MHTAVALIVGLGVIGLAEHVDALGPEPLPAGVRRVRVQTVQPGRGPATPPGVTDACETTFSTYTALPFPLPGTNYNGTAQGGFVDGEIAAATYTIPAASFPIRLTQVEMLFGAPELLVPTTTRWTVMVWQGAPLNGNLIASYSSDDVELPHLTVVPPDNGVLLQFQPAAAEPIIVGNNGTNSFSVGFRIDEHNSPYSPVLLCLGVPPPPPYFTQNVFPMTDNYCPSPPCASQLAQPSRNWLRTIVCAAGCNPNGGWVNFASLLQECRPNGDWVLGATWAPLSGAGCCPPDCDGDGVLSLADFGCFQTKFGLGDMDADCDGDGLLTLADFGCFQTAFGQGCP